MSTRLLSRRRLLVFWRPPTSVLVMAGQSRHDDSAQTSRSPITAPRAGRGRHSRGLNAICLDSLSVSCSRVSKGGHGPADSQESALDFNSIIPAFIDVAGGFTIDLSLNYVTTLLSVMLAIWSGVDGTGDLLATLNLPANAVGCPDYGDAELCPFTSAQVSFSGVARSVQFSGIAADFDDITFTAAPEASTWAMMLVGFASLAYAAMRRKGRVRVISA
jgi:hypothetical protein